MGIKSILCIFGGVPHELTALNTAMTMAQSHLARVRVLHISPDPGAYVAAYGGEISAVSTIMIAAEKRNEESLANAKRYVASFAETHQIPLDAPEALAHHSSAQFLHLTGSIDSIVAREGRLSDLIIIGRGAYAASPHNDTALIAALFNTGRPVLLMPKPEGGVIQQWTDKTIALAWERQSEGGARHVGRYATVRPGRKFSYADRAPSW